MQFMNHALTMTFITRPMLNPILVFRMVKMSIEHGICNISAFAFACYGAWLVSEPSFDVEGAHSIGRVATEMMKRLVCAYLIMSCLWKCLLSILLNCYEFIIQHECKIFHMFMISNCRSLKILNIQSTLYN